MKLLHKLFPMLKGKWLPVDLDVLARNIQQLTEAPSNPFLIPEKMNAWVRFIHNLKNIDYSYGGYLEDRSNLWQGHYHEEGKTVHLGVDFNVRANTAVCLPCDGVLVEFLNDSDQHGGWGGKITFECKDFFLTLAHMKMIPTNIGQSYREGTVVGMVAESDRNGGWYEHLHVQCSKKFDTERDAYSKMYHGIEHDFLNPFDVIV